MVKYTLKEKILKFLIENKEKPHSIREISLKLKADYKNTSQALNNLNLKTYSKKKQGNSYLIEFNPENNIETLSIEEKRTKEFLSKNPKMKLIVKDINEINYPFMIVLIFGSFANEKNTQTSDMDLCIISDNKTKTNKLIEMLNLFNLKIEIQEFTTGEFVSMIEKKQNNLGHEITKNNVILYGIENYYNLISNNSQN
ncbi:hypothetical protein GOV13_00155 [Candidatus Pacearchaeota archaeon]|nr:hypothetical protein [Candidatus Pacearchaeota archaeon]